ncbi:ABC transporter permease subunit [Anaerococcus sp. mt242]|uniref:ABC transporter permease n=1 Tax=Anaerococcus sp. mt242 TaxID=2661917 RepID=UPI001932DD72|nr:ABC transporter permease subunit [Anaerococcus sp. mt242]MBM0046345.1 ABC transporter permease subunit [Anaerococcus sp. mt242]
MKKMSKIVLYIYIIILIFAGIDLLFTSFRQNYPWPNLVSANYSLRSYLYLYRDRKFIKGILNSLIIGLSSSTFSVLLSIAITKKIYYKSRGYRLISFIVFLPFLIGATSIGLGLQLFFKSIGVTGSKILIIIAQSIYIIPYAVRILKAGYSFLSDNLIYAGKMLGAGDKEIKREIVFPILAPFIKTAFIMGFILSISEYYLTLVLGSGLVESFMTVAFPFFVARDRAISSAVSIVFLIINIIFILIIEVIFKIVFRRKKWVL